ncbi:hypothetical protein FF011L_25050 [Roseimaritima multifibrata]|uniref:Tetratricopeptide repeat protein n=1 Tax=Roseimaritima multifibrata TaxID=1930274 RepID=A0A517MFR7_9BACT|nr:tetratricopeptide repeat protein [Roseimaritima multifibrata]QDS93732.1 hypothetical protein FF011L_25050 [Roseimaritima multifibrata]
MTSSSVPATKTISNDQPNSREQSSLHAGKPYDANLASGVEPPTQVSDSKYGRVARLVRQGEYTKAIDYLSALPKDPETSNAIAVCLLRDGQIDVALNRLRQLVTMPGSIVVRLNGNERHGRNFATALLMYGSPSGALDVLNDLRDQKDPRLCLLRQSINTWAKSLPFFRRLDWKVNRIEPQQCKIALDFEVGEFDFET